MTSNLDNCGLGKADAARSDITKGGTDMFFCCTTESDLD